MSIEEQPIENTEIAYVFRPLANAASNSFVGIGIFLIVAASLMYLYAEISWNEATNTATSGFNGVGVGTSTYHAISFLRSAVVAIIGCGYIVAGKALKIYKMSEETLVRNDLNLSASQITEPDRRACQPGEL